MCVVTRIRARRNAIFADPARSTRTAIVSTLFPLLLVACNGAQTDDTSISSTPLSSTAPASTLPPLTDAAQIWCDETRWEVVTRASQLDLPVPSETNLPEEAAYIEVNQKIDKVSEDIAAGRLDSDINARLDALRTEAALIEVKYLSGEWHPAGVHDSHWAAYKEQETDAFLRSCQAAFDLR